MEPCSVMMGVPKRHSQFSDTKYKWRTTFVVIVMISTLSGCGTQQLMGSAEIDPYVLNKSLGWAELTGGVLAGGRTVWKADFSPYLLRDDLLIERDAELVIEPGVEVRFAPMIGITVRGKIAAVGESYNQITLTSTEEPIQPAKPIPDIRLVDGPSILAGRVQLLHRGQWRSVCTNSRNWTIHDMETACRQLGFMGGTFYNWMDRQPGRHARLLYEEPNCKGTEYDMFQCNWNSRQLGSGVCDYHPDLGIQCEPHHDNNELTNSGRHWRGIRFENAVYEKILTAGNTLYVPTSMSRLAHVKLRNAGLGRDNNATSALDIIGVPPVMEGLEVSNSAFNAINVTSPNAPIVINNCTIQNNRGYGVYVNSSYGMAKIENCNIHDNGGDGIKYVVHEMNIDEKLDRSEIFDLCTLASTPTQTFPIQMSIEQSKYSNMERDCNQKFYTRSDHVLTLNFIKMLTNHNDSAEVYIYDGLSPTDKLLLSFSIRNHTRPQSVTSTRNRMYVRFRANTRTSIVGFLRLASGVSKAYDLNVTDTTISDNNGRGVVIENLRSQVHIHRTAISNNNHVAGLQVINGAGDVNVTESRISFNQGDGINITVTGGNRNISRSIISSNQGYGVAIWINNTKETEYIPINQTTSIEYSEIFKNIDIGILHGNFCGDSYINITGNWFNTSFDNTIEISTCWSLSIPPKLLNLQIGHNRFYQNLKIPLKIQPALNVFGKVEYNYFEQGEYGAIVILNRYEGKYLEEFEILPARFNVQHNYFFGNKGPFVVNLGLSPYSDIQYLLFSRNFLRDNRVREPFETLESISSRLMPRSRVAATIVLASSNIDVFRNIISNPESPYEIGSHLEDQSKILNCTFNWLGFSDEEKVYKRLFHRKDRYNLAKIIYMPYLLHSSNPGATQINYNSLYVPQFNVPGTFVVGGEVDGIEILRQGEYDVDKDINIRPGGKLVLQSGVTLKFPPAIGMMVAGRLDARGKRPNDISFTLKEEIIMTNDSMLYETDTENYEPTTTVYNEPVVPIRLLGGTSPHEGRLQIKVNDKWGTVCNYRWNIINAALVCHQLGLALNPDDWFLEPNEIPTAGITEDIILSNVECNEFDNDITKCKAETVESFENSCLHENDVGIRCYETSWAGIRFSAISERADLQYVTVEKAGLLDYSSNLFKPALQIDFARHSLESVKISNNYHDGLGIIYSDLYGSDAINTVRNSEFSNNRGCGISFKQLGLKVYGSVIQNNQIAGISHDPHINGAQQREIAGWFNLEAGLNLDEFNYRPIILPEYETDISLINGETRHIIFSKHYGENIVKTYNIKCNPGYVLGIQLLNPIHNFSTEKICIYDSQNINEASTKWCLDRDLSVFPTTTNTFGVVLTYESGKIALGGVVLVVSSIIAPVQNIRNRIVKGPVPTLQIVNSKIKGNTKGVKALYYNRYLNELGDHFLRKSNESIKIFNCEIAHNIEEAVYVNTPFWDIHESNITEITIMINDSLITDNGKGIYHFARDLRSSNNLYHYILQDNTIERNKNGGFDVSLPYVWQYNENFTHSVYMFNNTWRNNQQFAFIIDGHFAELNISKNAFLDNNCKTGLISIKGMEKKMKIDGNQIERNNGQFMVQFNMDSQSEIMGLVYAIFVFNQIKNNRYSPLTRGHLYKNLELTYVVGFKGIQKVKVSRNLFGDNSLQYILVAGIKTAKINNLLDVTENWWGSADEIIIKRQIFDFDDWNNHAIATYLPYLLEDSFDSSVSVTFNPVNSMDINELGGRLISDLTIESRIAPYIIKADITVMPDVTLTLNPGVILEFAPNVGILVMGTLIARGHASLPIVMRPINLISDIESNKIEKRDLNQYYTQYKKHKRQLESLHTESIRLCTGRNCSVNDNIAEKTNEGFLEYYNRTTLQWVPMCDNRFTERNAQVVCRELGYDPINAFFAHDRRVEYHSNSLSRIWSWPEPLQCVGTEEIYEDCPIRLNGQLYGHRHECKWDSKFVFIHCGTRNLDEQANYWGGIRFTNPEFEYSLYEHRIHDHHTHDTMKRSESVLQHIHILGAGILHNEKSAAIQSVVKNPQIQNVNISKCAFHGINLISPTDSINMMFNTIEDVLGEGINAISLTGEGRESEESSFSPLKDLNLPYHMFSLIDICDSSKVITVEERVLLYYKYDNNPVNCVKIFKSMYRVKPFGFRLLQFNLFNHSMSYGKRDSISLYDGDIYNITASMIGYMENGSPDEKKLFRTQGASLSVKLFANGASSLHGFIAEIVTLPISAISFNRDVHHNITNSLFSKNRNGAISYSSVGEVNPLLSITRNEIVENCLKLYGNFTSCHSTVKIDVQNTQTFVFRNNLVRRNVGGLWIRADSRGAATSLRGWIHNNLFYENHDLECLKIEGRQSSPYQEVTIYRNYFTRNVARYKDIIVLHQVVSNFTHNYVHDNTGLRILDVSGFDKVRLPIYQTTSHNGFYKNYALDRDCRATIVAGTAGQHYVDNIFFNPDNDYEMVTVNRSIFVDYNPNVISSLELWRTKIDAKHNYWSYNESLAVAGRIRDQADSPLLLEVDYRPYYMNNLTVLGGGKCPPGWDVVGDTCYMYIGAPMTYEDARLFCLSDNASMPYVSGNYGPLYEFIQKQNQWYQDGDRVWVNHIDYVTQCTSFSFTNIDITDCKQKNAFICEIDPKITIDPMSWRSDILAIGFIGLLAAAVLLVGAAIVCWYSKSKHRHMQRLERRNSIRQSQLSIRSIGSINGGYPDHAYRKKLAQMSSRSTDTLTKGSDYKKIIASTASMESMEKSAFASSLEDNQSFDIYEAHNPNTNIMQMKHSTFMKKASPPEYSIPQNNNRPYNLAYRNEGYRDNSGAVSGAPSMNTVTTEEMPIIHHPGGLQSPQEEETPTHDNQYFNSDTLPLRGYNRSDDALALKQELEREGKIYNPYGTPNITGGQPKLSFLMELRSKLPDQPQPGAVPQSTFGQRKNIAVDGQQRFYEDNLPSPARPPVYANTYDSSPSEIIPSYDSSPRDSSRSFDASSPTPGMSKSKSKSEALLETNFDFDDTESITLPISEASRSHSQPLETAM